MGVWAKIGAQLKRLVAYAAKNPDQVVKVVQVAKAATRRRPSK